TSYGVFTVKTKYINFFKALFLNCGFVHERFGSFFSLPSLILTPSSFSVILIPIGLFRDL
ncbi:MAG: hypothetical protein ACOYD9_07610, partial [Pyramidobacter sp.]